MAKLIAEVFLLVNFCLNLNALVPLSKPETNSVVPAADHLKCYQIQDSIDLQGIINLDTKQFGLERDCVITSAIEMCIPASKEVVRSNVPILPVHGPGLVDMICYHIQCP